MLILFDVDETLVHSLDAWVSGYRRALGRQLPREDILRDFYNTHHENSFPAYGITDTKRFYDDVHRGLLDESAEVSEAEGAYDVLASLAEHRTIGVLTSRKKAYSRARIPERMLRLFKVFIDRDDCTPKPSGDGIRLACEKARTPLSECLFVGDSKTDADAAADAGVPFAWFKHEDGQHYGKELEAEYVFSSYRELPGIVEKAELAAIRTHKSI